MILGAQKEEWRTPVYRITYREEECTATLCNYGCNWNCSICSYKLREDLRPTRFLNVEEIKDVLSSFEVERLNLIGGEPLTIPDLDEIVQFAKEDRHAYVKIAHSNASMLPPEGVDEMGISLRAMTKRKHLQLTGAQITKVLSNIFRIHDMGIAISISTILIPEVIDVGEVEKIAKFIASVDRRIPLHISGYIPVPGIPWKRPTREDMEKAVLAAKEHLDCVTSAILSVREFLATTQMDSLHGRHQVA